MRKLWPVVLLLAGCPDEKPKEHAASAVPQEKKPEAPDASVQPVEPLPQPPQEAEVEFTGNVEAGKVKAKRIVFVVAKGPCAADTTELEVIEQIDVNAGKLFTEMFFPQGTVGHICAVALDDKGKQVGFAAYAKNPVTFQGEGEVEVKDVELKLTAVKARPAPKGL